MTTQQPVRREEFEDLRLKVNELIAAHNENTQWMLSFRVQMNTVLEIPIMRWFMWIREMHIPVYPKRIIRYVREGDHIPMLRK